MDETSKKIINIIDEFINIAYQNRDNIYGCEISKQIYEMLHTLTENEVSISDWRNIAADLADKYISGFSDEEEEMCDWVNKECGLDDFVILPF